MQSEIKLKPSDKVFILKKAILDIAKFNNFIYTQPRESNQDNNAFLTIGKIISDAMKDIESPNLLDSKE